MRDHETTPPGVRWILILGVAGFAAGFFGPMLLAPSSNIGPLVGIIMTGPAGAALGALLWAVCALFRPEARTQWRLLYTIATIGVLGILLSIRPEPELRGYVLEGQVESCDRPADLEAETIDYWRRRVAQVHWAEPRAGWEAEMREALRAAPGVVVSVRIERRNPIRQHQRLWNHSEFAAGWEAGDDETPFYEVAGSCDRYPEGRAIRGYENRDYDGPPVAVDVWPPPELPRVLRAGRLDPVPERWQGL
jgi:hypothetical protein